MIMLPTQRAHSEGKYGQARNMQFKRYFDEGHGSLLDALEKNTIADLIVNNIHF